MSFSAQEQAPIQWAIQKMIDLRYKNMVEYGVVDYRIS
jgi:hypothetical protein